MTKDAVKNSYAELFWWRHGYYPGDEKGKQREYALENGLPITQDMFDEKPDSADSRDAGRTGRRT